jgi:hypothetical protein
MPSYTNPYDLIKLGPGEPLSADGYKFTMADRDLMARLLQLGAETHHHSGEAASAGAATVAPNLTIDTTQGSIPAGVRPYYAFSFVRPEGIETTASPEAYIDMPPVITAPAAPSVVTATTGGTLRPGHYYYVLSAYTASTSFETPALAAATVAVSVGTLTNRNTLTLPVLPGGASGFNVYRRTPSGHAYLHVGTIDMTGGTPPTTFVDSGSLTEDCDRFAPTENTTQSINSVQVAIPGSPPALPGAGWAWRIYRTYNPTDWSSSLLTTISDGSLTFLDLGNGTFVGQPPSSSIGVGTPSRILLTDGAEVQGRLRMGQVSAFPHSETFAFAGPLSTVAGTTSWVCPFPQATLIGIQPSLGRGYTPAATDVLVNVNRGRAGTWVSVFTSLADRAKILVGNQVGAKVIPTAITELLAGDLITVDIDQTGGGGTPTDRDLTVVIYMYVYGWTGLISHAWAP